MLFGRRPAALSEMFWEPLEKFIIRNGALICSLRPGFWRKRIGPHAERISAKGCMMENCVGFIDGSKLRMSRPGGQNLIQRAAYSGHKRFHCLNFQTITVPDGIVLHLFGPLEGRRHDSTLYRSSGIDQDLEEMLMIDGGQHCIHGDPAFLYRPWAQVGFKGPNLDEGKKNFNRSMSKARICAERAYKDIKLHFAFIDFSRKKKALESPISLLCIFAALLINFEICFGHGSQAMRYFSCLPPDLKKYLEDNEW